MAPPFAIPTPPSQGGLDPTADALVDTIGRDMRFEGDIDGSGDLPLGPSADYDTVEGLDYARQWIMNCLETDPDEYKLRPGFGVGVRKAIKRGITRTLINTLAARGIESLGRNPLFSGVDVRAEKVMIRTRPGVRMYVTATVAGIEKSFLPFDFVEDP